MDFSKELLKAHNKQQAEKIARFVGGDSERFAALIEVYLDGPREQHGRLENVLNDTPHLRSLI